jgi:hypothetical protein
MEQNCNMYTSTTLVEGLINGEVGQLRIQPSAPFRATGHRDVVSTKVGRYKSMVRRTLEW